MWGGGGMMELEYRWKETGGGQTADVTFLFLWTDLTQEQLDTNDPVQFLSHNKNI